ncbi:GNAT family N-acetyltransferase [Shewanella sp. WXL01]|uniref:GNAT family N-acetyltransferase n=1 Tax=Shewanella sp. WXL01 TaxID=2709721 RepID=UPI001438548E|nr:GNAT family N-acetyltransferase [Shewanella sp. WXL01]NKF50393.1 GNAT family N-acetyltransferase [Shewanella sp. WXL01]
MNFTPINDAPIDIETERLSLRLVTELDSADLYKVYSDPEVMKYWSCSPFTSESQATELAQAGEASFRAGQSLFLGIVDKESKELIGTLSVFNIHQNSQRAEVGYILSRKYWHKGLMSEAFSALLDYCFEHLQLNRLEADIDPNNTASAALLIKHGFKAEGLLKERWIVNGNVTDSEIYGLLRADFKKLNSKE